MKKWTEEKIYVYIALFFGILFIFLTPPFQSPDEDSHFKRSYQISKGALYPVEKDKVIGNYFPNEMISYIGEKGTYMGDRDRKYSFTEMVEEEQSHLDYDKKMFQKYSTVTYIPIVYFPPAIGIIFGKLCAKIFGLRMVSTAYMLYFARLFSLFFTVFLVAMAIKITPIRKKTFLTVGLIPMLLFLSSMVSYDNMLNASLLLAIAIILNITYNKNKIETKDLVILGIIGTILLNIKTIYFLIFILMFTIPAKKFGSDKDKIKKGLILIGGILLFTAVLKAPYLFLDNSGMKKDYVSKQISFIINHPLKYTGILYRNIRDQRFFQLSSTVGLFGLLDVYNPIAITLIIYINLILIGLSEGITEKIKITKLSKILIVVYSLLAIVGVYTALYITWTPEIFKKIGTEGITGVQGRYFIPVILPLLLLLSFKTKKDRKIWEIIKENYLLVPIIVLTVSIFTVVLRFWV